MTISRTRRRPPRQWTAEEDAELRRMHAEGMTNVAIAKALDRAQSSVTGRLQIMPMRPEEKQKSFSGWDQESDDQILDLRSAGKSVGQIAQMIGRSYASVDSRFHVLEMRQHTNKSDRKERTCLCCQRKFMSAHSLNRICGRCGERAREESPYNPGITGSI